MAGYKEPTFQERSALAEQARAEALKKLAAKPQMDEAEAARRKAAQEGRAAATAAKSAARKAAIEQAKADKQSANEAAEAAAARPVRTEADLKADRDAKYAARKARRK